LGGDQAGVGAVEDGAAAEGESARTGGFWVGGRGGHWYLHPGAQGLDRGCPEQRCQLCGRPGPGAGGVALGRFARLPRGIRAGGPRRRGPAASGVEPGPRSPAGPERRAGDRVAAAAGRPTRAAAGARRSCSGARRQLHDRARGDGGYAGPGCRHSRIAVPGPPLRPQHPAQHHGRGAGLDGAGACAGPARMRGHPRRCVRAPAAARARWHGSGWSQG
jgi:hypothetical protein